jgi:hypothetical protein
LRRTLRPIPASVDAPSSPSWPCLYRKSGLPDLRHSIGADFGQARGPVPSTSFFAKQVGDGRNKSGHDGACRQAKRACLPMQSNWHVRQYFCDRSNSMAGISNKNDPASRDRCDAHARSPLDHNNTAKPTVSRDCRSFRAGRARKCRKVRARRRFEPRSRSQPAYSVEGLPRYPWPWALPLSPIPSAERGQTSPLVGRGDCNAGRDAVWLSRARKIRGVVQKGVWRKPVRDQAAPAIGARDIAS